MPKLKRIYREVNYAHLALRPPVILYYGSFQDDTSAVVLIVLCLGVDVLRCMHLMYILISKWPPIGR